MKGFLIDSEASEASGGLEGLSLLIKLAVAFFFYPSWKIIYDATKQSRKEESRSIPLRGLPVRLLNRFKFKEVKREISASYGWEADILSIFSDPVAFRSLI